MKLNEKWERICDKMSTAIDDVTDVLEEKVAIGIIIRQCLEIQQRLDEIEEKIDGKSKS